MKKSSCLLGLLFYIFLLYMPMPIFSRIPNKAVTGEQIKINNLIKQLDDKEPIKRKEAAKLLGYYVRGGSYVASYELPEKLIISRLKGLIEKEQVGFVKSEAIHSLILYDYKCKLDYLSIFNHFLSIIDDNIEIFSYNFKNFNIYQAIFTGINDKENKTKVKKIFKTLLKEIKQEQNSKRRKNLVRLLIFALEHDIRRFRTGDTMDILTKEVSRDPRYYFVETRLLRDISEFKIKEGLNILLMALETDVPGICSKAALNIGFLGDKRAVPHLIKALETYGVSEINTVLSLGVLNVKESLPIIIDKIKLLTTSFDSVRAEWIAAVIDKLDREKGLNQLKLLLNHENEYVRRNAEEIIRNIVSRNSSEYLQQRLNK